MRTLNHWPNRLDLRSRLGNRLMKALRSSPVMPSIGPYNLTISSEKKFLWFRVAKVCTRTVYKFLKDAQVRLDAEHAMLIYYPINRYADYFKFAFVRNPWDRLVSCWHNKIVDRDAPAAPGVTRWRRLDDEWAGQLSDFSGFVEYVSRLDVETCDIHLRLQCRLIDLAAIDYLGRFESFDSDLAAISRAIGLASGPVGRENASNGRRPYREYYDERLAEKVHRIYKKDIQIFGYRF